MPDYYVFFSPQKSPFVFEVDYIKFTLCQWRWKAGWWLAGQISVDMRLLKTAHRKPTIENGRWFSTGGKNPRMSQWAIEENLLYSIFVLGDITVILPCWIGIFWLLQSIIGFRNQPNWVHLGWDGYPSPCSTENHQPKRQPFWKDTMIGFSDRKGKLDWTYPPSN